MSIAHKAFELVKANGGEPVRYGSSWWQLVDGYLASGISDHKGKLVLQEDRDGCHTPFNHWGFYIRDAA